jgi:predicted ATPase
MKIQQLAIEGFRSLRKTCWIPGDLNVLIGPNGTGKSNLLRLLELISASVEGRMTRYVQIQGGFGAIAWDGRAEKIAFKVRASGFPIELGEYELELGAVGTHSYSIKHEYLDQISKESETEPSQTCDGSSRGNGEVADVVSYAGASLRLLDRTEHAAVGIDKTGVSQSIAIDELKRSETLLSALTAPFADFAITVFRFELERLAVYHGINTLADSDIRQSSIASYSQHVDPDGQNLISALHTNYSENRDFKTSIDSAMSAAFGVEYEELVFPPAADQRVQLRVRWRSLSRAIPSADLSDGTLRFLYLLTILADPSPPTLIAIDEPETGLHPSMLPIVADFAEEASLRTQVVLTTHSEALLNTLTRKKVTVTVTKWEHGETTFHNLNGEELDYWLKDYSLGELYASNQLEGMA